jgi:hypothetical protein
VKKVVVAFASAISALACACEEVPTLTFAQEDAALDGPPDAADAGSPPASDADVDGGCPGSTPPSSPFICCGPVACEGQCTGQCDACMTKCTTPGDVCCAKANNVVCLSAGSICH